MTRVFAGIFFCLALGACARVQIVENGGGDGYDVFRPEPYLLVYSETTTTTKPTGGANMRAEANADDGSGKKQDASSGSGGTAASAAEGIATPGMVVVWLPNYGHRYRVRTSSFFAKAGAQFEIRDGWMLTGFADQSDNTALITAAQAILGGASSAATGGASKAAGSMSTQQTKPGETTVTTQDFAVYKFVFDEKGEFYGLAQIDLTEGWTNKFRNKLPPISPLNVHGATAPNVPKGSN